MWSWVDWINISASWKRPRLTSGFWSGRATPLRCCASREPTRRFKVTQQAIICQWALASLCPHSCLVIYIVDNNRRLATAGFSTERSWREWSTTRSSSRRSPGVFLQKPPNSSDIAILVRMYDQADVNCLVENEEGENVASTNLDVNYAPTILLHPRWNVL